MPVPIGQKLSGIRPIQANAEEENAWRQRLVGKYILKDDEQTTLGTHEFVRERDLPQPRRILPPNSVMTMDYRPERLNVHLDHSRKVRSVNYG
ncbi:hypothetical protein VTP01DRAFT_8887 [Rhizomucor pusillus]|uniref:uncharacterized protein n=1 Tax=Rhizomucor pusillus TaxID=4840 RepID=UPI003744B073